MTSSSILSTLAVLLLLVACAQPVLSTNALFRYTDSTCSTPAQQDGLSNAVITTLYNVPLECFFVAFSGGSGWVNWRLQQSDTSSTFHFESWTNAGCSAAYPSSRQLLQMDAQVSGSSFTCAKGTYSTSTTANVTAYYTLVTDTVPGAGAGGGAGDPVVRVQDNSWSMTTKMMLGGMVLAAAVIVGLLAYGYYQRHYRNAASQQPQQQLRAPLARFHGGGAVGGGVEGAEQPQAYTLMS